MRRKQWPLKLRATHSSSPQSMNGVTQKLRFFTGLTHQQPADALTRHHPALRRPAMDPLHGRGCTNKWATPSPTRTFPFLTCNLDLPLVEGPRPRVRCPSWLNAWLSSLPSSVDPVRTMESRGISMDQRRHGRLGQQVTPPASELVHCGDSLSAYSPAIIAIQKPHNSKRGSSFGEAGGTAFEPTDPRRRLILNQGEATSCLAVEQLAQAVRRPATTSPQSKSRQELA